MEVKCIKMWTNITSGFDVEDETANFGTRALAESEVAVFETNTLATIQAENKDILGLTPSVHAEYYLELGICLFIDNSVILFNESCSETLLRLTFDATVDAVGIVGNGKFILIGLNNGELYLYHISTETRTFTRSFKGAPSSTKTFVKIDCCGEGETLKIFIITSMGQIHRITNLNLEELETACTNKDSTSVEEITQRIISRELFSNSNLKNKVNSACRFETDEVNSFLLAGKDLYLRSEGDDDNIQKKCPLPEEYKLKKIEITQNKSLCVGLTETEKILILCMHTLMPIFVWEDLNILDFTLLDGPVFDADNNLLVITREDTCSILLVSWPGFQIKFKLQVQYCSHLVYQQNSSDDILFAEGFGEGKIDTVRLKAIVEGQPEFRLQRILRKGRFEEAEKFARTFNLDIELVYKAQVQRLMQDLQPWNNNPESVKVAFYKFMALLEKITDIEFLCECCVNAIPPDFTTTQMLLDYGESRLSKLPVKSDTYVRSDLLQKISFISQRLSTFQQICGYSANSESWLHFLKADLFEECQKHLKKGNIREFVSIWSRHLYEINVKLDWTQALMLLEENIPTWVKAKDITLWLHHFVPTILSLHPDIPQRILQWSIEKIKTLEFLERETWPEVGLDMANNVLRMLEVPFLSHDPLVALQKNNLTNNNCALNTHANKLLAFIKNLRDIQTLKHNYSVVISCADFLQLSNQELMNLILIRTSTEQIRRLVSDFLKKMMIERNLVSDTVISNFIQEMVDSSVDWSQWDEAPWEMSVAALIPCIHSIQDRLECVLKVLTVSSVPWSNLVKSIAEDALKLKHPLTKDVEECVRTIPQKLIYKKYGFKKNFNIILMIKQILLQDRSTALEDVLKIAESAADKTFPHQIILKQLIEKGKYASAMEVLARMDSAAEQVCKDFIINTAEQRLKLGDLEELKNYAEILHIICTENELIQFKKYYNIKMDKNMDFSLQDFWDQKAKKKRLSDHTAIILKGLLEKQFTEEEIVIKIPHFARLLDISSEEWILSIATQAVDTNFDLAYSLASNIKELPLLPDDEYSKVFTLAVYLFVHYKPEVSVTAEDLVELICKLATQSVLQCSSNYLSKATDMLSWFGLLKSTIREHRNVFSNIYMDPIPSTTTVISLHLHVQKMLHHYICAWRNSSTKLDSQVLEAFENATMDNLFEDDIILKLPAIFGQLRDEQQYLTGISLLTSFYWSLCSLAVPFEAEKIEKILNQSSFELLKKLTNSRHFDLTLALGFLHHFETEEALSKLGEIERSVSFNYQRLSSVTLLGLAYCKINNIDSNRKYFNKKHTQCMWAKKLSELGIPPKEAFKESDPDQQRQLLKKLMKTPGVTLDLLREYCLSMRVHFQECLILYLEEILLSWEPAIEFKIYNSNKKEMVVKHSFDELKKQCLEIINAINSETKQQIINSLLSLWDKVNCYYYEVFLVIIELIEDLSQTTNEEFKHSKLLLGFLRTYVRISKAQSEEEEHWFQLNALPPIAEFRLPFTLLCSVGDCWKIIKPELNLTTYKMWFDVITFLRLDKNNLCSLTIQQLTSNQLSAGDSIVDPSGWCVHRKNKSLLIEIKDCVENITNLEMATASLYYVVTHMPPGADQVAAAEMCYLKAQDWVNSQNSDEAQKGFVKVEKKYLTVSTSHILYSHLLGEQKYLQLVLNPDDLIYELYCDPSILKRKSDCTTHLPDINGAVDAIGNLNGLNLKNIRFEILNDWLRSSSVSLDSSLDDATSNITVAMFHHKNDNSSVVQNENLIRACYLLESIDKIMAAEFLSGLSFGSDDVEYPNIAVKLRALQCLCAITSNEIIEQVTGRNSANIREYKQTLLFVHELNKLGLSWAPDKSEIVRVLLKRSNPHALSLAAAICRVFNLNIPAYWDSILSRMVAIEMVEALSLVLPDLTPQSHIINKEVFKNAWNCVILTPLSQAIHPLNEEGRQKVEKSKEMLLKCPIPFKIDKKSIIEQCQRLEAEDILAYL